MKTVYGKQGRRVRPYTIGDFRKIIRYYRYTKPILTTCGCFDILHVGHLRLFEFAASQAGIFVVGINSDESVRRQNKGSDRPIVPEEDRAIMVAGFAAVDYAVIFDEDLPNAFLELVKPDIHIKGSEYELDTLPEQETVESNGGTCVSFDMVEGKSTTAIIEKINTNFESWLCGDKGHSNL